MGFHSGLPCPLSGKLASFRTPGVENRHMTEQVTVEDYTPQCSSLSCRTGVQPLTGGCLSQGTKQTPREQVPLVILNRLTSVTCQNSTIPEGQSMGQDSRHHIKR